MRRSLFAGIGVIAAIAAVALAAGTSMGGGKYGQLVGKDSDKGDSAVAVALASINDPGKMTMKVTTKPRHRVAWNYTTDCLKDGKPFQYPPPGESQDKVSKSPVVKTLKTGGVQDPDSCDVVVSAKLDFKAAKKVTAKIFNK